MLNDALVLNEDNLMWLYLGLALVAILTLAILLKRYLHRTQHTRQINKLIRDLSHAELHQILVPDSVDGEVWIDCLLLTDGGVLVLDIRDYTGKLFGGQSINQWTQMIGVKSHKFDNPLLELPARVHAVQALVGDIPVIGQVVFSRRGTFPKGQPAGVCMVDEVYEQLSNFLRPALPDHKLRQAWSKIEAVVRS